MSDYAKKSLEGIWVGDCIGNLGQLYFVHDILKALEGGMAKFGGALGQFHKQFQYSDDTEEGIVLYNHLITNKSINQDKLAMEFATRFMERDPDGEIYGYGLNTRKVLKDIFEGVPWKEANKFIKKSEGMPSHVDSLVDSLSKGKGFKAAINEVNLVLQQAKKNDIGKELVGSCGNGAAMRVAPLGAYIAESYYQTNQNYKNQYGMTQIEQTLIDMAVTQAEVTHDHDEGIAGSIAITTLAYLITRQMITGETQSTEQMYTTLLRMVPSSHVAKQIAVAKDLPFSTPIGKAAEILGNGTHVTCQDTVPLCVFLTLKHLSTGPADEMYEKAIIETSMAFGDVDTNCAIVGGMIGIAIPPPVKWKNFCQPMEGVVC